jgi:uncharacterized radical SAM superfamily protein
MSHFQFDLSRLSQACREELEERMVVSRELSWRNFGRRIRFYAPGFVSYKSSSFRSSPELFPSVSVTGDACSLKCKHCQGKLLKTMIPAFTPAELVGVCRDLKDKGCLGLLISGGCLPDGSVPLNRFVGAMAHVKRDLGLKIVVHTGLIDGETARRLKEAGVDAALIDIIGSDETIQEVYQLNAMVKDYDDSLRALHEAGIPSVPHVLIGLHYGKIKGEFQALEMISKYNPAAVIAIALTSIRGTVMEDVNPPAPEDVVKIIIAARLMMPTTPIVLGCMRPKGRHRLETDKLAVRAGVNAIAFPTEAAINLAESMGLAVTFSPLCCSQIFEDL